MTIAQFLQANHDDVLFFPERDDVEDEPFQRRHIGRLWGTLLGSNAAKIRLTLQSRRKTNEQDFHDRWVTISCSNGRGVKRKHEIQLTRGLLGLMDDRLECLITYLPPADCDSAPNKSSI